MPSSAGSNNVVANPPTEDEDDAEAKCERFFNALGAASGGTGNDCRGAAALLASRVQPPQRAAEYEPEQRG